MKKYIYIQVLLLLIFIGCNNKINNSSTTVFYEKDFPEKVSLKGVEMIFDSLIWNPKGIDVQDSLLIIRNEGTKYFYDIFLLNETDTNKFMHSCLTYGNGPKDRLHPVFIPSNDSNIWIYDIYGRTLSNYTPIEFFTNTEPAAIAKYNAHYQDRRVTMLPKETFLIASQNFRESRFSIFSLEDTVVKQIGTPMSKDETIFFNDREIRKLNTNKCITTNTKDRIIVSYFDTDLIEIFDLEGNKLNQIFGPNQYLPNEDAELAHFCYTGSCAVGNEVFFKYSDMLYNEYDSHDKYILVFDWDGNPLRMYELDIPIIFFTVDSEKRIIYGTCNKPECRIIKYQY
jgi:hypothetical protein